MSIEAPNHIKFQSIATIPIQTSRGLEKNLDFQQFLQKEAGQYKSRADVSPKSPKMNTVWLEYNSGSKKHTQDALDNMKSLKKDGLLKFTNIKPYDQSFEMVLNGLKKTPHMRHLIIRNSSLAVNHIANISRVLQLNDGIAWLVLDHNKIDDRGVKNLSEGIKNSKSLKHVVLADNSITDEGMIELSNAIKGSNSIESLWVQGNQISDNGAEALVNVMKGHPSLKTIDIRDNSISEGKLSLIKSICEQNNIRCYG